MSETDSLEITVFVLSEASYQPLKEQLVLVGSAIISFPLFSVVAVVVLPLPPSRSKETLYSHLVIIFPRCSVVSLDGEVTMYLLSPVSLIFCISFV